MRLYITMKGVRGAEKVGKCYSNMSVLLHSSWLTASMSYTLPRDHLRLAIFTSSVTNRFDFNNPHRNFNTKCKVQILGLLCYIIGKQGP
jgi:hypothetical protein